MGDSGGEKRESIFARSWPSSFRRRAPSPILFLLSREATDRRDNGAREAGREGGRQQEGATGGQGQREGLGRSGIGNPR